MWRILVVLIAYLLSACSTSPTSKQVAEFGKSADAAVAIVKDARSAEVDLVRERTIERQACSFLRGSPIVLAAKPDGALSPNLAPQLELLGAISDYAAALSKATDPQVMADVEAAAGALSDSTVAFAGSLPSASSSPLIGPAVHLVSTVAIDIVEMEMRARLRKVIQQTDPFLRTATTKLLEDLGPVQTDVARSFAQWKRARACSLEYMRANPGTPRSDLYASFKDADSVARQFQQRIAVLDNSPALLSALLQAHFNLLNSDVDIEISLQKLKAIVKNLEELKKALAPVPVNS